MEKVRSTWHNFKNFFYRRRYELLPSAFFTVVMSLSWWQFFVGIGAWGIFFYCLPVVLGLFLVYTAAKARNQSLGYTAVGVLLMSVVTLVGVIVGPGPASLIVFVLCLGIAYTAYWPWIVDKRHERVKLHAEMIRAQITGPVGLGMQGPLPIGGSVEESAVYKALSAMGVEGAEIMGSSVTEAGHKILVSLPPGKSSSPEYLIGKKAQFVSNLGLPGTVRMTKTGNNMLEIYLVTRDYTTELTEWDGPSMKSATDRIALGLDESGSVIDELLLYKHVLIAGGTDNGKSGVVNVFIGNLVNAENAEVYGIDMKPGAPELGPWRGSMTQLATDKHQAKTLLEMLEREVQRRGQILSQLSRSKVQRKWEPGVHGSAIWVVVDELAELVRQDKTLVPKLLSLHQLSRYVAVHFIEATQSPSRSVFGGNTDIRQQYDIRIGVPAAELETSRLVFGAGSVKEGWDLRKLSLPGQFLLKSSRTREPRKGRAYYVSDEKVMEWAVVDAVTEDETEELPAITDEQWVDMLKASYVYPDGTRVPDRYLDLWRIFEKENPMTRQDVLNLQVDNFKSRDSVRKVLTDWQSHGVQVSDTKPQVYSIGDPVVFLT